MAPPKVLDVQAFIDAHRLSSVQVVLVAPCFLIVAIDGFDTAAIGFDVPAIRADWGSCRRSSHRCSAPACSA
jgi:AAHS family 4-hydroxybenzoate transporter-like MFS transporter